MGDCLIYFGSYFSCFLFSVLYFCGLYEPGIYFIKKAIKCGYSRFRVRFKKYRYFGVETLVLCILGIWT
jgi:hypothetical protein